MKEQLIKKNLEIAGIGVCTIENWQQDEALNIFRELEVNNWAPWLAAEPNTLAKRSLVFPKGQLVIKSQSGIYLASVSTNKIYWDGDKNSLPSWDEVAGEPATYENTYRADGNAIVLMSMNVNEKFKKHGLARLLIEQLKFSKTELGILHIIGSFRPNEYGVYKLRNGDPGFTKYCSLTNSEGLPIDGWLRSLTRNGMKPLKVDTKAMTVSISIADFEELQKTYKQDFWKEIDANTFECGEVGRWYLDRSAGKATYIESNLWGIIL